MTSNPTHYVSLPVARELAEKRILFPESEDVWVNIKRTYLIEGKIVREKEGDWFLGSREKWNIDYKFYNINPPDALFPAPLLMEILDELGGEHSTGITDHGNAFCLNRDNYEDKIVLKNNNKRVDAAAKMLIKLREKG